MVSNQEDITRYYFNSKNFRADNTIKHNEFMPPANKRMSVYRTTDLSSDQILDIGRMFVEPQRNKPIVGRGEMKALEVINCELEINPDTTPHPRHANIEGWYEDTEKNRLKALKLAAVAKSFRIM